MVEGHNKSNYIFLELQPNGNIVSLNDFGERIFGLRLKDISGKNIKGILVKEEDDGFLKKAYDAITKDQLSLDNYFEYHHILNEKDSFDISWVFNFSYNKDGSIKYISCIGTNVTEKGIAQKKINHDLKEDVLKHERNRIANEIHDTVSQTLFALSLSTERLNRLYEKDRKEELLESIKNMQKLSSAALSEIRILLYELKPDRIMEETFAELIRSICHAIFNKTNIEYTITGTDKNFTFTYDEKFSLYRICQQAFFNISKHSKASKVIVTLESESKKIKINISDDGIGFNANEISSNSLGIKIMKNRAKLIGASLEIISKPKQGTEVDIEYEKL
jgi:PAS domain S-box-containing protein